MRILRPERADHILVKLSSFTFLRDLDTYGLRFQHQPGEQLLLRHAQSVSYTHLDVYKRQLPDEDQGYLFAALIMPEARSLQLTTAAADKVSELIRQNPNVKDAVSYTHLDVYKRQAPDWILPRQRRQWI